MNPTLQSPSGPLRAYGRACEARPVVRSLNVATVRQCFALVVLVCAFGGAQAAELRDLWKERLKSVVAVEFFTETELDRRPTVAFGLVIDKEGTIILPGGAVNPRFTPSELKDFRIYLPGASVQKYTAATYLGQDVFTSWHLLKVADSLWPSLVPVTAFAGRGATDVKLGQEVWGLSLRGKDEDFAPYLLQAKIALFQTVPQRTAVCMDDVAAPGLPVFDAGGAFVGIGLAGFGQSFMQFSQRERNGEAIALVNLGESAAFLYADEVLPYLGRRPLNVYGRSVPWFGAFGMQTIDPEVATFLKVDTGVVVSEVLAGSPAEVAGLKNRDVIVAIDGKPLPRLKPDRVLVSHVQREVNRRMPGEVFKVTVLRDKERIEIASTLVEEPKLQREAERKYFDRIGLTAREMVYADGIVRRAPVAEHTGIVAHFVKANSPAAAAGVGLDDWIKEIDGVPVKTFAEASAQLNAIQTDLSRAETVLLIRRGGETQVLRIKLK